MLEEQKKNWEGRKRSDLVNKSVIVNSREKGRSVVFMDRVLEGLGKDEGYGAFLKGFGVGGGRGFKGRLQGLYGSSKSVLIYKLYKDLGVKMVVVTSSIRRAEAIYQDIKEGLKGNEVYYFPSWEVLPYDSISPFYGITHHRIEVLHELVNREKYLLITPLVNLMRRMLPRVEFEGRHFKIEIGGEIDRGVFEKELLELGYSRVGKVTEPGDYAVKGGIIDLFPSSSNEGVRIEFNGDEVESIRLFDCISQLSKQEIEGIEILAQKELILKEEVKVKGLKRLEEEHLRNGGFEVEEYEELRRRVKNGEYFQGIENYLGYFYNLGDLGEYMGEVVYCLEDEVELRKEGMRIYKECELLYHQSEKTIKAEPKDLYRKYEELSVDFKSGIEVSEFKEAEREEVEGGRENFDLRVRSIASYKERTLDFVKDMKKELDEGNEVYILSSHREQSKRIKFLLGKMGGYDFIDRLKLGVGNLESGFKLEAGKIIVVLDREILGKVRSYYKRIRKVSSSPIANFYDLKRGDIVVHINHGVGKYIGIEKMKTMGKAKDFILIEYKEGEKLYVPTDQLNWIQKYIGVDQGKEVLLDKLGGKSWEKKKARVKREVEEMARDLLEIYASRSEEKGYQFSKDSEWQYEFENGFEHEETVDQLRVIEEIKKDMESKKVMDRLVCGDVGYGKTEVVIRGIFKAVMDGKQVIMLAPTTILCEQHYRVMRERLSLYPVRIEMLSRVRKMREQREIILKAKEGELDVLIGTQRILSKDVGFKRLGLVVIDEEQRFGVKHKEALKRIRKRVDVISLTATPIPRTLHMSLTKMRDMSVINTAPENRLPVETYTMEFNDGIIKMGLRREFERGGQVYFVHNRIQSIEVIAKHIEELSGGKRVCIAHGQMEEEELEGVVKDFIDMKYEVMVCTTIIESGIDIENVNTIFINRAEKLGLAQLYQLRGRVGRGGRKAYCYLFYSPDRVLSELAQKRLGVLNEYTDLGSGFSIAMKDMEFRGAGNVLGLDQSGYIGSIGYEMYCQLLEEVIERQSVKNEEGGVFELEEWDMYVDLKIDGYIPSGYVSDENQKIEIYKRIAGIEEIEEIGRMREELGDRFGVLPEVIENLLYLSEVKVMGKKLGVGSIMEHGFGGRGVEGGEGGEGMEEIVINFRRGAKVRGENLIELNREYGDRVKVNPEESNKLYIYWGGNDGGRGIDNKDKKDNKDNKDNKDKKDRMNNIDQKVKMLRNIFQILKEEK